jgi:hypothetical protein
MTQEAAVAATEKRDDDSSSFDSVVIIAVGLVPLRLMIAMKRGRER